MLCTQYAGKRHPSKRFRQGEVQLIRKCPIGHGQGRDLKERKKDMNIREIQLQTWCERRQNGEVQNARIEVSNGENL